MRFYKLLQAILLSLVVQCAPQEWVEHVSDQKFIHRCYKLAEQSVSNGNHPFGALLVLDGEIVLEQENNVLTEGDVTSHAELALIRTASKQYENETLRNATLYTSTEPCAMCSGALYWSGISRLVFGVSGADLAQIASEKFVWSSAELFQRSSRNIQVVGPIDATLGRKLHISYWSS